MTELKNLIIAAKNYDSDAMYEIISRLKPIIMKYTRNMNNNEDLKSDLILHVIEITHRIDLDVFRIPNDYAILKYYNVSLYHKYIGFSKKHTLMRCSENHFENDELESLLEGDLSSIDYTYSNIFINEIKQILTKREFECLNLMIIEGYSSAEASTILGISRQTVNENKNRALKKIRSFI